MTRLDEFDSDEWFDVCRKLRPSLTREEYTPMWEDFRQAKIKREMEKLHANRRH